jgi:hypothetical protein
MEKFGKSKKNISPKNYYINQKTDEITIFFASKKSTGELKNPRLHINETVS